MIKVNVLAGLFSPGQIAGMVIVCIVLALLIGVIAFLFYLLYKRGVHKMQTRSLQQQRDALLQKLNDMRSGKPFEFTPMPAIRVSAVTAENDDDDDDDDESEAESQEESLEEEGETEINEKGVVVRYNRSFKARVIQADNDLKARYSEMKNYLLAYGGIHADMSWRRELFSIGRSSVASILIRGKTLCFCFAIDPSIFDGTKYKVSALGGRDGKTLPCMYRVKNDLRMSYAKEIVDIVMAGFDLTRDPEYSATDYTMPHASTEALVKRHLIKIMGDAVPDFEKEDVLAAAKGIRYNRSFTARIIQSDDALKARYSKLKNYLLAHEGMSCTDNWKREEYGVNGKRIAAVTVRGKTLCLWLATDPKPYLNSKYKVEDASHRKAYADTPLMYRIRNDRRMKYALQLIDKVCVGNGVSKVEREHTNYAVPFTSTDKLVRRGLITITKMPPKRTAAESADQSVQTEAAASSPADSPEVLAEVVAALDSEAAKTSEIREGNE